MSPQLDVGWIPLAGGEHGEALLHDRSREDESSYIRYVRRGYVRRAVISERLRAFIKSLQT